MDAIPEIGDKAPDPLDSEVRAARLERRVSRLEHQLIRTRDDLRDEIREVSRRLRDLRELAELSG
jgi:hypothetical protein